MKPLLISFSGGRTSAYMTKYLLDKNFAKFERVIYVVFANTGKERQETLDFIHECDVRWKFNTIWIEADIREEGKNYINTVKYENASRNGEPFEKMIKRYGIPNKAFPHCTRELKQQAIKRFTKGIGLENYDTAIGIRADEIHRINWENAQKNNLIYPLATEHRVNKEYIRKFWDNQDFDLQLKDYEGNCDMCWKKSDRKLFTLIKSNPSLIDWWNEMEIKYGKDEFVFFRKNRSAKDMIEEASKRFRPAIDEHEIYKMQSRMFDDLDIEYDCFCKTS